LTLNKLSLEKSTERTELIRQLHIFKDNVPVIHMTFAVEADTESLGQIAQWLRESIHPQAVIAVGLQPGLVAGVYLRTPNHVHDLSLRTKLRTSRGVLLKELEALHAA
jgi:F0F1-type ATP synthase delta subunit